jgi:hypothetical protein
LVTPKEAAGVQMRIAKQVRLAHHRAGSDARLLQLFHNLPRQVLLCQAAICASNTS